MDTTSTADSGLKSELKDQLASCQDLLGMLEPGSTVRQPSVDRAQYDQEYESHITLIGSAMALRDIGGTEAARKLAAARKAAAEEDWAAAIQALQAAHQTATLVLQREPWVELYTQNLPRIDAACGVRAETDQRILGSTPETGSFGSVVETAWKEANALAKDKHYTEATALGEKVLTFISTKLETDSTLLIARVELAEAKKTLSDEMRELMNGSLNKVALGQLKAKAIAELQRTKAEREVGVDPAIDMNTLLDPETDAPTILTCEQMFKKYDWFEIKDMLHNEQDGTVDVTMMTNLWKFRQGYVTKLIDTVRKGCKELIAKASGSTDLESDIDITFSTPASGEDVEAARLFNQTVMTDFGKPAGRTFDVNIYIREYGAGVKESFNEFHSLDPIKDANLDFSSQDGDWNKLTQMDQDAATLLKQRRFLSQEAYHALKNDVIGALRSPAREQALRQYEEAENGYLLTLKEKLIGLTKKLNVKQRTAPSTEVANALSKIEELNTLRDPALYQTMIDKVMGMLERKYPSLVMETTDEMYLDRMAKLRRNEALVRQLEAEPDLEPDLEIDSESGSDSDSESPTISRDDKIRALKVQIKKDITTNIIFANEAYISEGAIQHVVQTGQARDLSEEDKIKKIKAMDATLLMQSTNEQLADFFKDISHYSDEVQELRDGDKDDEARRKEGEAYVHASKYMVRMLDAAWALALKYEYAIPPLRLSWFDGFPGGKLTDKINGLKGEIDGFLYQLRKSATVPNDVKGELAVVEIQAMFAVTNIDQFNKKFQDLGRELNQAVRMREDFTNQQSLDSQSIEGIALSGRELSERESAMSALLGVAANPMDSDRRDGFSRALTALEVDNADAIVGAWIGCTDSLQESYISHLRGTITSPDPEIKRILTRLADGLSLQLSILQLPNNQTTATLLAFNTTQIALSTGCSPYYAASRTWQDWQQELVGEGWAALKTVAPLQSINTETQNIAAVLTRLQAAMSAMQDLNIPPGPVDEKRTKMMDELQARINSVESLQAKLRGLSELTGLGEDLFNRITTVLTGADQAIQSAQQSFDVVSITVTSWEQSISSKDWLPNLKMLTKTNTDAQLNKLTAAITLLQAERTALQELDNVPSSLAPERTDRLDAIQRLLTSLENRSSRVTYIAGHVIEVRAEDLGNLAAADRRLEELRQQLATHEASLEAGRAKLTEEEESPFGPILGPELIKLAQRNIAQVTEEIASVNSARAILPAR
jgi:hypothetical protein